MSMMIKRGIFGAQVAIVGPGIGFGFDEALSHVLLSLMHRNHRVIDNSAGAPVRLRFGEQVMTMIAKVRM